MADQLIEALSEQFFSKWTYASLTGLTSLDSCIKLVLQIYDVNLRGRLGRDVTHPQRAVFSVFSWGQDRIEVVLVTLLFIFSRFIHLVLSNLLLSLSFLICDASGDQDRVVITDE